MSSVPPAPSPLPRSRCLAQQISRVERRIQGQLGHFIGAAEVVHVLMHPNACAFGVVLVQAIENAEAAEPDWRDGRSRICRYFVSTELPKARQQLALVKSLDSQACDFADTYF